MHSDKDHACCVVLSPNAIDLIDSPSEYTRISLDAKETCCLSQTDVLLFH